MKDISKVVYDMAKTNGVGRLIVGPNVIPVKVMNIKHENTIDSSNTEFECTVINPTASYVDTDSMYPGINSAYGMMGGRSGGKTYDEYVAMKKCLKEGRCIVPFPKDAKGWMAEPISYMANKSRPVPGIDKVTFNNPATIVFWEDGTKTVVKCQNGEPYDPEKGLAMAITKRALGNRGNYCNILNKHLVAGMERFTPEQYNSEVCHINEYEELHQWCCDEMRGSAMALIELRSVMNDKKATKADIVEAVNKAMEYLSPDNKLKEDN